MTNSLASMFTTTVEDPTYTQRDAFNTGVVQKYVAALIVVRF